MFSRGEYNESNEFFIANEDDVASLLNLKDMRQKEVSPIGCSNWCGKECNLLDPEGVNFARDCVTTFDPREVILDNILGHDHANLTILYYPEDISSIMIIWKWSLA